MGNKYYRVNTSEKESWDGKGVGEGFLYGLWELTDLAQRWIAA